MILRGIRVHHPLRLSTMFSSVSLPLSPKAVRAKICLIHETVVEQSRNVLGILHRTNFTIVKVHNCPIYTQCCDANNACCFDFAWFWTSAAVILFILLLAVSVTIYSWYKKRRDRPVAGDSHPASTAVADTNGDTEIPLAASVPRQTEHLLIPVSTCPKPPAYATVSSAPTPQPGAFCPEVEYRAAPPPYSSATESVPADNDNSKSLYTQTTAM